jgi:hypothetical protein
VKRSVCTFDVETTGVALKALEGDLLAHQAQELLELR